MITLITGPPCAGKTTWVDWHAQPGDLVVDYDRIAQQLGSPRSHNHHAAYARDAGDHVDRLHEQIARGLHPNAWVINTAPSAWKRNALADTLGATRIVILIPDRDVLLERATHRPHPDAAARLIDWWLNRYDVDDDPRTEVNP